VVAVAPPRRVMAQKVRVGGEMTTEKWADHAEKASSYTVYEPMACCGVAIARWCWQWCLPLSL